MGSMKKAFCIQIQQPRPSVIPVISLNAAIRPFIRL